MKSSELGPCACVRVVFANGAKAFSTFGSYISLRGVFALEPSVRGDWWSISDGGQVCLAGLRLEFLQQCKTDSISHTSLIIPSSVPSVRDILRAPNENYVYLSRSQISGLTRAKKLSKTEDRSAAIRSLFGNSKFLFDHVWREVTAVDDEEEASWASWNRCEVFESNFTNIPAHHQHHPHIA